MSNPVYNCPHCEFKSTTRFIIGHLMANHPDTFKTDVLKFGMKGFPVHTQLKLGGSKEMVHCCLGCKKFWSRKSLADKHFAECTAKAEHKKWCSEQAGPQISETSDNTELLAQFAKLQAENEKLKKKVERLEKEATFAEKRDAQFDKLIEGLRTLYSEEERNELSAKLTELNEDEEDQIDWYTII